MNSNVFDQCKHTKNQTYIAFCSTRDILLWPLRWETMAPIFKRFQLHVSFSNRRLVRLTYALVHVEWCCSHNTRLFLVTSNTRRDVAHTKDSIALFKVLKFLVTCISILTWFSRFVQIQNVLSNCKKLFKRVTYYQNFPWGRLPVDYVYLVTKQLLCSWDQCLSSASMHKTGAIQWYHDIRSLAAPKVNI